MAVLTVRGCHGHLLAGYLGCARQLELLRKLLAVIVTRLCWIGWVAAANLPEPRRQATPKEHFSSAPQCDVTAALRAATSRAEHGGVHNLGQTPRAPPDERDRSREGATTAVSSAALAASPRQ